MSSKGMGENFHIRYGKHLRARTTRIPLHPTTARLYSFIEYSHFPNSWYPVIKLTVLVILLILAAAAGCTPQPGLAQPETLTVSAAASLTEAFSEIGALFESANPQVKVTFNFAGSQELAQQIIQGAAVAKPFGQEELLARVRAFLRRSYVPAKISETKIEIGDFRIDLAERRVFIANNDLHLTKTEYAILAELARHLDAIVTHDELIA